PRCVWAGSGHTSALRPWYSPSSGSGGRQSRAPQAPSAARGTPIGSRSDRQSIGGVGTRALVNCGYNVKTAWTGGHSEMLPRGTTMVWQWEGAIRSAVFDLPLGL